MGMVTVENLDLRFPTRGGADVIALNNLSMTIPDKEFAVIVGPSGCGKSSLLDIIAGLKEPSGGLCRNRHSARLLTALGTSPAWARCRCCRRSKARR